MLYISSDKYLTFRLHLCNSSNKQIIKILSSPSWARAKELRRNTLARSLSENYNIWHRLGDLKINWNESRNVLIAFVPGMSKRLRIQ
jgi:hypothetical protein